MEELTFYNFILTVELVCDSRDDTDDWIDGVAVTLGDYHVVVSFHPDRAEASIIFSIEATSFDAAFRKAFSLIDPIAHKKRIMAMLADEYDQMWPQYASFSMSTIRTIVS